MSNEAVRGAGVVGSAEEEEEEQLMAAIEDDATGLHVGEPDQLGKPDEDEQLMAAIEAEVRVTINETTSPSDADLLVAAERAVAPLPPMFDQDLEPKKLDRALEHGRATAPNEQRIVVARARCSCLSGLADILDTTGDEHSRRHNAYTRERLSGSARWAAIRKAGFGSLVVLPGLWCLMGVLTATLIHSGGSIGIIGAVWGTAGLVTLVLMSLRLWRVNVPAAAAQPVTPDLPTTRRVDPKLAFSALWLLTWVYAILLFLVPATVMVEMKDYDYGARGGAYLFLAALWCTGWGHHWLSRVSSPRVEDVALMPTMPDGLTFQLRVAAVIYESYVACGFSFFPALPWVKTSVPKPVTHFFEAASFDFGVEAHTISFLMACAVILAAFAALAAAKRWGGAEQFLMVVDVAFESLMFPVCRQLIGVLSCTRGDLRETTRQVTEGNTTTFTTKRLCDHAVGFDASCMDGRPDVECWSEVHLWYVLGVFIFLVPYYIGGVKLRTEAQKQTSTVVIDGLFSILAFQIKFLLAVISSGFGACHPWLVLASVEVSVSVMLIALARRNFSNVLQLTALRVSGLGAALLNGFVASYVAWRVSPDSCAEIDITVYGLESLLPDDHGSRRIIVTVTEVRGPDGGLVSSTTSPEDAPPLHEIDARARQQVDLTQDYSDFVALVSVNAFILLAGFVWYHRASARLAMKWDDMKEEERSRLSRRVDYPIVRKRLLRLPSKAKKRVLAKLKGAAAVSGRRISTEAPIANMDVAKTVEDGALSTSTQSDEFTKGFMMCVSEELEGMRSTAKATGKQLEDLTIELLLFKDTHKTLFLKRDPRVCFFGLDLRTSGCERLFRHFKNVLQDQLGRGLGCLAKVTCEHCGRHRIVPGRRVEVQFAPKPLALAASRRWAEGVEERLCFLAQVPMLKVIDISGTGYGLELLAVGACDPVLRSQLSPATLSYVVAGTRVNVGGDSSVNHLPADASGKSMGYDMIPATVKSPESSLDALVLDFMNPSAQSPAVIGTRDGASRSARPFARIYSEFCDLFAEGCLQWKVEVDSKLSAFAKLKFGNTQDPGDLIEWIAQIMDIETACIVNPKYSMRDRSASSLKRVRWTLSFQIRQKTSQSKIWNKVACLVPAVVLSNFIKGFLQSDAIRHDHQTDSVNLIARAWRARQRARKADVPFTAEARSRVRTAYYSVGAFACKTNSMRIKPDEGRSADEDAILEKEGVLHIQNRELSRTDKFKALRQMVARRVPGSHIGARQFDDFEKYAGKVIDWTFTCVDVRSKDLGPWHVALIAAWISHHPVTELLLGDNECIGQVGKSDWYLDPWCRTVKRLVVDAKITSLDISSAGMGPAGLLVLTQGGLLGQLTTLNLSSNPIIGHGTQKEQRLIKKVSKDARHHESRDAWTTFCDAVCRSHIAVLHLSKTGLGPHSLRVLSDSLHRNTELIVKHRALHTMSLADNDLTANGDLSGLSIFLVSASFVGALDISATALGPPGAEVIANEFSEMISLTSLNIAGNGIGVDGATLMAHKLQQHSQDLKLLVKGNAAEPTEIPVNQRISHKLDLSGRELGPAEVVLCSALLPTLMVAKIDLSGNDVGYVGKVAVATALRNWKRNGHCPIEQLRIDLGKTSTPGFTMKVSQKMVNMHRRDISIQDLHFIAGFLEIQQEVDTLDLSDNKNLFCPRDSDVKQWETMCKVLSRTTRGRKHGYHVCPPLFTTNQELLWTDHDLQSWSEYTKQLLGDAEEDTQHGCRRIAKPGTVQHNDVVQHAWWRLCQSIQNSSSEITDLRLSNVGLTPAFLVMLSDGFQGGSYVREEMRMIDLHKNVDLTGPRLSEQTDQLDEFLSKFGAIAELNLSGCGLGNSSAKIIGKHLCKISMLNIVNNPDIGVAGAKSMADNIISSDEKSCRVQLRLPGVDDDRSAQTRLSLFASYIGEDSKKQKNRNLAGLGLEDDPIRLQIMKIGSHNMGTIMGEISHVYFHQTEIMKVGLARAGLRDPDAIIVAAALSTLRNLGELDVQGNKFGAEGKEALAEVIQELDHLHTLMIDIGDHQPPPNQSSSSGDGDDVIYPDLQANANRENPSFRFGGTQSEHTQNRGKIDLSHMDLRAEDLLIVAAWIKAPLSKVSEVDLSHNEMMLRYESTRDARGRTLPASHSFVHLAWSKFCGAVKGSNIHRLILQKVGLSAGKEGQRMWCIDPLVRVLERTATLRQLDISGNFVLRPPYGDYSHPSDEEKVEWELAATAKKAIAQAIIRRSEGWLPYAPLESGHTPVEHFEAAEKVKCCAMSTIAGAMARLQQDTDQKVIEYKSTSKPAYKPLEVLQMDLGTPSSKQRLTTAYGQIYAKGIGTVNDVRTHQTLMLRNRSLRADDALLVAALVTVWDNSRAVSLARVDVAENMLGLVGRKLLIDAFTRGPRTTFKESARLIMDVGRWEHRTHRKQSSPIQLEVPIAADIKWHKGLGQKHVALLSAWLREAVAHKKSNVRGIDLSFNPCLGWWDMKNAIIDLIVARDKQDSPKGLKRMNLSQLHAILYDQEESEEIEGLIVQSDPDLCQIPPNLRHGLDKMLTMLSRCKASAEKLEVLELNDCGLNTGRLTALAEAIRPDKSTTAQTTGFVQLSELHLNDNPNLVSGVGANLASEQPWDRLCQALAKSAQHQHLNHVGLSGCRLNAKSVAMLMTRLTEQMASKNKNKRQRRLTTLDISKNVTFGCQGGKILADALVVGDHGWPVSQIVVGHNDRTFLMKQQGIEVPSTTNAKKSIGAPRSDGIIEQDIESDSQTVLPLDKWRQIETKEWFQPLKNDETKSVDGRVLDLQCAGLTPGIAWVLGEWLIARDKIFSTREHADMAICCLKLQANPLTGSSLGHSSTKQSLPNRAQREKSVKTARLAGWEEAGGTIDDDPLGFGKLCEAFGLASITDVDISYCGLGPRAMYEMTKSEHNMQNVSWLRHAQLQSLNLSNNPIGIGGREYLKEALCDADIQRLTVDIGGAPMLLDAARTKLDFSKSRELKGEDAIVLAGWITVAQVKTNLVEMDVSHNDLCTDNCNGFADLMEAVPMTGIMTLKMSKISLNPQAVLRVADMIDKCVSVRDSKCGLLSALDLSGNTFVTNQGHKAFRALCNAIGKSTIGTLDLSDMQLSDDAVDKHLRPAFKNVKPSQIKQIIITGNDACCSDHAMQQLVSVNSALQDKLVYRDEQKLSLNDEAMPRYQNWLAQQKSPKPQSEDAQLKAEFADLPPNPYSTTGGEVAHRIQPQKPAKRQNGLSSTKSLPAGSRRPKPPLAKRQGGLSRTKSLSGPPPAKRQGGLSRTKSHSGRRPKPPPTVVPSLGSVELRPVKGGDP